MTRIRKNKLPLSSFDPRYRDLLLRGAKERFILPTPSLADARNLRARIHTYRSKAQAEGVADWEQLYHCKILAYSAVPDAKGNAGRLEFVPRTEEFSDILSAAGVTTVAALPNSESLLAELEAEQGETE